MTRRRRRGSGGHPAKVAQRRNGHRQHQEDEADSDQGFAEELCEAAARFDSAIEAEFFVSQILGAIWNEFDPLGPADDPEEAELEIALSLVNALAKRREPAARGLLATLGFVAADELALIAIMREVRLGQEGIELPDWASDLSDRKVVRATTVREKVFDDARTIWLESLYPSGNRLALGVLIDHNAGEIAKDIAAADSIDEMVKLLAGRHEESDAEELVIEDLEPGDAAEQILLAVATTDTYLEPPVTDEYATMRALVLEQISAVEPTGDPPLEPAEVDQEHRDRLLEEFLISAEASEVSIAEESDGAEVARLAIDFGADYGDGRPLRWSPIVVELFMADWLPRKVAFAAELESAAPDAIAAWVRFAGRKREIPEAAIETTVKSIEDQVEPMREAIEADDLSPAAGLIRDAEEAGVRLDDREALDAFIESWNARQRDD